MKTPLLIIGSSGHAKVVIDAAERSELFDVIGLIDRFREPGDNTMGYTILGNEAQIETIMLRHPDVRIFVAIGDNYTRGVISNQINSSFPNSLFAVISHPSAVIAPGVELAAGTFVAAGAIVSADAKVGKGVIINTGAQVDHDCSIGDFSSLAPGVILGGNVKVGLYSALGIGSIVLQKKNIGHHAVIGAGSVVTKDVEDFSLGYGNPFKHQRTRSENEPYLR